jgi:hypothetical protein
VSAGASTADAGPGGRPPPIVRRRSGRREHLERQIIRVFEERTGRRCVFMPSARFAAYVAFRSVLSPGDRLLMSALEDDTIFFGALAAGVRPIVAPASAEDGNIRPDVIPDRVWRSLQGVLTMNMYGVPDRIADLRARCRTLRIPLIEDAAHALESDVDGRPIGSFGSIGIFSLSKHIPGVGGVLSLAADVDTGRIHALARKEMRAQPASLIARSATRSAARASLEALGVRDSIRRRRQRRDATRPTAWRVPLRERQLSRGLAHRGLDELDPWMATAYADYRMPQRVAALQGTLSAVRGLEIDRSRRLAGVEMLRRLPAAARGVRDSDARPLLRVPFLVRNRNAVAADLRRRGIPVYFVYDPPLDQYAPHLVERAVDDSDSAATWWASHVLPIDPLDAGEVAALVADGAVALREA